MDDAFLVAGLACLIAAVVGGGLKAFEIEIPVLASLWRQALLGLLGAGFLMAGGGGDLWKRIFPDPPPRTVMGPLEPGVNLQGMDFDAFGQRTENEQLCAELCRTTADCKAMTYVLSRKTCWLKTGVPPASPQGGPDFVSAVKR